MNWMTRVCQILRYAYGNTEGTGNYRLREDHTEYEIEFLNGLTSKITANNISEACCIRSTQREGTFSYLRKYLITGRIVM